LRNRSPHEAKQNAGFRGPNYPGFRCTPSGLPRYAKRKSTVEPVFGIIKHVMGFRQFSLRGLAAVTGEWTLVTLAFNLKRMNVLRFA
jgi:hypothetical protein